MKHTQTDHGPTAPDEDGPAGADGARLVGSDRVLAVLKELARHPGGVGLEELTRAIASPKPTVHRALGALRRAGLADQDARGRYVLGDEFLRMAFAHHEARPEHVRVRPVLDALAHRFGETAHYAVLDGREVVYRAKVDPPTGAVRLTSTIGGRNPAHTTAVGKLLLTRQLDSLAEVEKWVGDCPLEPPDAPYAGDCRRAAMASYNHRGRRRRLCGRPGERERGQLPRSARLSDLTDHSLRSREHQRARVPRPLGVPHRRAR
ncbi:hypothetical protein SALBM311S_05079 [Streptomyces alboniger]